ncbi:unnamed protein product [Bursaphelenchus okinawaensis]|uniref:Uncharacterized protein n=1 Tax=Bursaphelenchus okinawaensis TaxID=465554 RepID=A0A811KRF9_9BILA|nr:unnamed protein product [Bursaphelenchus okinawaensis]CAG9112332.1 unnamed protein product [Bursaphelenchus okinawaensis]
MGDDLAAFFAKKKSKGTKKKAIRMDDVVQQLESNMKFDKDGGEDDVPSNQDILGTNLNDEDSEWIGYGSKPLNLAGETVGTFNSTEVVDEEVVTDRAERESSVVEKTKTWNIPSKDKEDAPKETVIASVTTTKSKFEAYKPPQRSALGQGGAVRRQNVDLRSEEMFPSLGDADKIEKQQTEYQKKQRQEEKATTPVETKPEPVREVRRPEPVATTTLPTPALRPTNRPVPTGNIGTGIMNAKGEYIVLNEPKDEPEPVKKEVQSWRASREERPAPLQTNWRDDKEDKPAPKPVVKSNPFGAATPVVTKLPESMAPTETWRNSKAGAYQPPRGGDRQGPPVDRKAWGRDNNREIRDARPEPPRQEQWRRDSKKEEPVKSWKGENDQAEPLEDGWSTTKRRR